MQYSIPSNTHVVLATPAYGALANIMFTLSCGQWTAFHEKHGIRWNTIFSYSEALIQRARNHLVHEFLKMPTATHLFFVDADISFRVDDYVGMLAANKDIIVGAYPKKQYNWENIRTAAIAGKANLQMHGAEYVVDPIDEIKDRDLGTPFKVKHGGTGFMLIKRSVFEKLAKNTKKYVENTKKDQEKRYNFFSVAIDNTGLLLSEDYYFCREWQKAGGDIWCAPWVQLTHWGMNPFYGQYVSKEYE